jgi:hypothetical protein
MREMMVQELHGSILHDEFINYLKNYNALQGQNVYPIYDMILAEQDDPKDFLYLDIAKATAIVRNLGTAKDSGEKVICRYLQQADALTNTLQLYNFSYSFLQWLIAKYGEFGMTAEVLIIEKEVDRRGFHETRKTSERFNL